NLFTRSSQMFREAGFTPKVKMSLSQLVTSYRLADNGIGATFISDRLVRSPRSSLRFYKIDSDQADRTFYFLFPKRNYMPFAVKEFMIFASSHIPNARFLLDQA
ncbi:MAG: LysR family transcriptional regulator substrate-binding protein, partial [bacterium]